MSHTKNLLWTEGKTIVGALLGISIIGLVFYIPLVYCAGVSLLLSLYFFRNPSRTCPETSCEPSIIICPADGRIVDVQELSLAQGVYQRKISIFLSPLDVHVQWVPMTGMVESCTYKQGKFTLAFVPKSSELNERNDMVIKDASGRQILVRQIAGTLARRICCWVHPGMTLQRGEKYGMITFGSRVDILLPEHVELDVKRGDRVYGGITIIGRWIC